MEDWLTTRQAAARLELTPAHVRRLCADGQLFAARVGRDWMIEATSVAVYASRERKPGPKRKD